MSGLLENIISIDKSIFYFLNGMHSPYWDVVMSLFTRTESWVLFYGSLVYFIIRNYRMKSILILLMIALSIAFADQFSGLIKYLVQRLRPTHDPSMEGLVHNVLSKGGLYGYFSAHAANTFSVAVFTSLLFRNRLYSILIFIWAIIVSYTRIYLGVHFPFDVLTGIITGAAIGYGLFRLLLFLDKRYAVLGLPKLGETKLERGSFNIILLIFFCFVGTVLLLANRLIHFNLIQF